jgi:hypothetical protein
MAAIKTQNIRRSLLKKGFMQAQTHHEMYYYAIEGKKTSIRTRLSHGAKEYDDYLLGQMAVQLKLEKMEFLGLIDCSLSGEGYFCKLRNKGLIRNE